jgi:D-alanyl-D-alanine dipeptidase
MPKRPWQEFQYIRSRSFVQALVKDAREVTPDMLVDMATYSPYISLCVAYAQDRLLWNGAFPPVHADSITYAQSTREERVNKFGLAYRPDASLWLHETLARITAAAANHLYHTYGWRMVLYDGLRTVDGAYNLYLHAHDNDMSSGLLSLPGTSAHNKGLAVDSMMLDEDGLEVDMGGHFDHLDMSTNGRNCNSISAEAIENRRIREAAFLRGAFSQGLLVAPLRGEFWDDRLPENREDLWRVMDSAARVIGLCLLTSEDDALRKKDRGAFAAKWESWSYAQFLERWQTFFAGHEEKLVQELGTALPPTEEKPEFYHGNYHPIYESAMPPHLRLSKPR